MTISLLPEKMRVLIIGGGRAGFIKAKSFSKKGCSVYVLSKQFIEEFKELNDMGKVVLITGNYDKIHIADKHIVIIATDDENLNEIIKNDCESSSKIYLSCEDFNGGMFITPVQRETDELNFSIHTKSGSPRTSVFIADMIEEHLKEYDEFAKYVCNLRESLKGSDKKDEIMRIVNTREFYERYRAGSHEELIESAIK